MLRHIFPWRALHHTQTMSLGPFFRSPLTDLTGCVINHQAYGKCAEFEMDMMDCLEAYGVDKGVIKCKDLIADFQECVGMKKQMLRITVSAKPKFTYAINNTNYDKNLFGRQCATNGTINTISAIKKNISHYRPNRTHIELVGPSWLANFLIKQIHLLFYREWEIVHTCNNY